MRRVRRLATTSALVIGVATALSIVAAGPASAHPLGNFTINRYSGLDLRPGHLSVLYVLDMAEIPTYEQMAAIDANGDGAASADERQAWADGTSPLIRARLSLLVDGVRVPLRTTSDAMVFRAGQAGLPILRFTATFEGALRSGSGAIAYRDDNYPGRIGWKEITARSGVGVALTGLRVPTSSVSRTLLAYPKDLLRSPLDVISTTFGFRPGSGTGGRDRTAPWRGETVSGSPIASGGSFARLVTWRLTPLVLVVSLALAFAFGALHALGPGHGKTITAAYLVGSGAKRRQAAVLGAGVSLMHTVSVLALGVVLFALARTLPPERVYPWLEVATGVVALGLGAGLVAVRLRAWHRGDDPWAVHGHPHPDAHHHGHGPGTEHHHDVEATSRPRLLGLAVAGGILPSPTAFVVLTGALAAHRIAYGLALITAFSAGLAAALMAVGLFAIRARVAVSARLRASWSRLIPVLSAAVIVGFGLFFAANGAVHVA